MTRGVLAVAVLAAAASPAHAEPACVVTGRSVTLQEITVQPAGEPSFQIGIKGVPVAATLPARCGAPLLLNVGGAIDFTASRDRVWLRLARDVTSSDGLVTAKRGAQVIDACMQGKRVVASAVLYSDDVLEGEYKEAGEVVRGFDIPCDALTLDAAADTDDSDDATADDLDDENVVEHHWELRGEASEVTLRTQAKPRAPGHNVESPSYLRQIRRKGGWVMVEVDGEGVTARGWVPMSQLKRVPEHTIGRGYGCYGDHGGGGWGEGASPTTIEREGTVRMGTGVYAAEGTGLWGTFAKATHVKVRIRQGSHWAELRVVPGLDGNPSGSPWLNGNVRLDTIKLDPVP